MPIKYDKLMALLKEKGYTTYKIRKDKLIGQGTLTALKNGTGGLDSKTISRLCKVLECQPGIRAGRGRQIKGAVKVSAIRREILEYIGGNKTDSGNTG